MSIKIDSNGLVIPIPIPTYTPSGRIAPKTPSGPEFSGERIWVDGGFEQGSEEQERWDLLVNGKSSSNT